MLIIGDIHGCIKTLKALLNKCPKEKEIYTVGDLIDRGSNSKEVVQFCIDNNIKSVMGNHEHMFLDYLDGTGFYDDGLFLYNGGSDTIVNYHNQEGLEDIPKEHKEYLASMPYFIEDENVIISHAGIPLNQTVENCLQVDLTSRNSLLWNRQQIAEIKNKLQVFGHTPQYQIKRVPNESKNAYGVNIDTGCIYPSFGTLTALYYKQGKNYEIYQQSNID